MLRVSLQTQAPHVRRSHVVRARQCEESSHARLRFIPCPAATIGGVSLRPLTVFLCATVLAVAVAGVVAWLVDNPAPPPVSTIQLHGTEAGAAPSHQADRGDGKQRAARDAERRRNDRTQSSASERADKAPYETPPDTTPVPAPAAPGSSSANGGFAPPSGDDDDDDDDDPFDDDLEGDDDDPAGEND